MADIFTIAKKHPEKRLIHTEQAVLDMDHHQAGSWLARKWQLPEDVSTVIEQHHYTDYREEFWQEAMLVGFASRMARHWILGVDILIPDEPDTIHQLGLDRDKLETTGMQCLDRLEDIRNIAEQMSN